MKLRLVTVLAAATAMVSVATPAFADGLVNPTSGNTITSTTASRVQTGTANGMSYTAASRIVGVGSTATAAAGGNSLYFPSRPAHNGVVSLIMQTGAGAFICSGSLLADRRSILTAAHCVSDGAGTANPIATTAYFYGGSNPDTVLHASGGTATGISISNYYVNPNYTGEVIDQNDIAVLTLSQLAPNFATAYELATEADLTGLEYNIAGVGGRSTIGGDFGVNAGTGRLRQGFNTYDFRLGDAAFGGFWTDRDINGENFFGTADIDFSYLSDFDNGLAANDASCRVGQALGTGTMFCDLGLGKREVSSAGGDSGGPQFVNGRIASVTSYGLSFGTGFGDIRAGLNSSFGEFNGFVPTFIHTSFINSAIPEASTWVMMILGFGLVGSALRRRQEKVSVSFG